MLAITDSGGIILDETNFYATSGGQPGDSGHLERADGSIIKIATAVAGETKQEIVLVPADGEALPAVGEKLTGHIDWERRYNLMRMHTACHVLSVVCPYPITSASVGPDESRVDFDIPEAGVTKEDVTARMMEIINANHPSPRTGSPRPNSTPIPESSSRRMSALPAAPGASGSSSSARTQASTASPAAARM